MGELVRFPRPRLFDDRDGLRLFIAGVDDELVDGELGDGAVRMDDRLAVQYVSASVLEAKGLHADLWIERPELSALDRTAVLRTLGDDILEQDETGHLYLNGAPYQPGVLVDCRPLHGSEISLGTALGLLSMHREGQRCLATVSVLGPVLWTFSRPRTLSPAPVLDGWRTIARELWRDADGAH